MDYSPALSSIIAYLRIRILKGRHCVFGIRHMLRVLVYLTYAERIVLVNL